jgi:hypothetical protein
MKRPILDLAVKANFGVDSYKFLVNQVAGVHNLRMRLITC